MRSRPLGKSNAEYAIEHNLHADPAGRPPAAVPDAFCLRRESCRSAAAVSARELLANRVYGGSCYVPL